MGKHAAAIWASGQSDSLSNAAAQVCKQASLTPEQILRVIENTNSAAFHTEFYKAGAAHGVVDFGAHGPAKPTEVFSLLGAPPPTGPIVKQASLDYGRPPARTAVSEKTASSDFLSTLFPVRQEEPPPDTSAHDFWQLRTKLAGAQDQLVGRIELLENTYNSAMRDLANEIKQASMQDGVSLGQLATAWGVLDPSGDYVKVAFEVLQPLLLENNTYRRPADLFESLSKHASIPGPVNTQHPVMELFAVASSTLDKLAEFYAARTEITAALNDLDSSYRAMKLANAPAPGVVKNFTNAVSHAGTALRDVPKIWKGQSGLAPAANAVAEHMAPHVGNVVEKGVKTVMGNESMLGDAAGSVAGFATKHAVPIGLAAGGMALGSVPAVSKAYHTAQAYLNPLSSDWDQRQMMNQQQQMMGGYY